MQKERPLTESENLNQTLELAGSRLWQILQNKKKHGLTFRRNDQVGMYKAEFCCFPEKLILEVSEFPFQNAGEVDSTMERHLKFIEEGFSVLSFDPKTILHKSHYVYDMIQAHIEMNRSGEIPDFDFGWN